MRRGVFAAMLLAALMAAGMPVEAQVKLRIPPPQLQVQKPPQVSKPPQLPILVIKPSQALSIASRMVPNAKPVGVKLLNNNTYAVTLRQNNVVTRVIVDAETGAAN
jgi:uncharacterized membrane protein YkoI